MWAIDEAARWWRRNRKFRPAICEIRQMCEAAVRDEITLRDRLRAIVRRNVGRGGAPAEQMAAMTRAAVRRIPRTAARA